MTTVGEFKKKFEELPDTASLEFWAVLDDGLIELVLSPASTGVRLPSEQVAEVVLRTAEDALRVKRQLQLGR